MRTRVRVDELMDDPALDGAAHDQALAGLARLNAWSRSPRLLWPNIRRLAMQASGLGRPLRVLDVATGSGDAPIEMARRCAQAGIRAEWILCDASSHALAVAEERAALEGVPVRVIEADAIAGPLPVTADVAICSLFIHHCERGEAVSVLRNLRDAAELAVGVTDLDRTRSGLALAWLGSRILSRSPIVHFDALASVRAAFSVREARAIAIEAGMPEATFERAWPERWRLWWRRSR